MTLASSPSTDVSDAAPVVALEAASKTFGDGQRGLDPIDLRVEAGAFLAVIGPSGCGKSTLLKLIANLETPTEGRVTLWNGAFSSVGGAGKRLAFVFQDPTLMPWANVIDNVRLPLDLARVPRADADARALSALDQVDLRARADAMPRALSGGMRMRVSIARALVTGPDLLLLDEPFGALDELSRNRLDEELSDLSVARGLTAVLVTHSIYEAVFLASRIIVMAAQPGRIHADYAVDEPRPRRDAFRSTDAFAQSCRDLSALLQEAARALPGRPA